MTEAQERHIEVPKTARYWVLGEDIVSPDELWFVLHGYRQLAARFLRRFEGIADGTRRIVAPEALSRFYVSREPGRHGPVSVVGGTWMTREDRENEIRDYVRYLDMLRDEVGADGTPTTVLAFNQFLGNLMNFLRIETGDANCQFISPFLQMGNKLTD